MSTGNHSGKLNISVPYKTVDVNNFTTTQVFYGTNNHLFSKQSPEIQLGLDFARPLYAFNVSMGLNVYYKGDFYSVGSGINLYLGQNGNTLLDKTKNCNWIIRPSLNINFFSFSTTSLGSNPYKKAYTIQIFASYFIPIFESSGLIITQKDNNLNRTNLLSGSSKNSLEHHNEISASYNNHKFNSVAFHANHIYIGVTFGITLSN